MERRFVLFIVMAVWYPEANALVMGVLFPPKPAADQKESRKAGPGQAERRKKPPTARSKSRQPTIKKPRPKQIRPRTVAGSTCPRAKTDPAAVIGRGTTEPGDDAAKDAARWTTRAVRQPATRTSCRPSRVSLGSYDPDVGLSARWSRCQRTARRWSASS